MEPILRAQKLKLERDFEVGLQVIEHMILYYVGIDQKELEEYWNQVLRYYKNIK